ncbi:unnamed protein product, partial [Linum tenue]
GLLWGPWLLGETYLTVHRWYKGFNPWTSVVRSTIVWVQLPELPVEFVNKEAVMRIGEAIGNPIRVDRATELGARAQFARVCVEVDLTRPLLSQYKIEGIKYLIQYEGLENICGECGVYGSKTDQCECQKEPPIVVEEEVEMVPETQITDPTNGKQYGEWMTVKKKGKKTQSGRVPVREEMPSTTHNKFHVLHGEEEERRNPMQMKGKQGRKENETTKKDASAKKGTNIDNKNGELEDKGRQEEAAKQKAVADQSIRRDETRTKTQEASKKAEKKGGEGKQANAGSRLKPSQANGEQNQEGKFGSMTVTKSPNPPQHNSKRVDDNGHKNKGAGSLSPSGYK